MCLQDPATCPYPESNKSRPRSTILFLQDRF